MVNIVVVFPQQENARSIRNILVKNGFHVVGVCVTGTQAVSQMDGLNGGIVVCGYKMADMLYSQLHELLPTGFEMLLMASGQHLNECLGNDIVCLSMPLKVHELVSTVGMMAENQERRRRRQRALPKQRNQEEKAVIKEAKALLMERNNMTEEEAHRYLQKCSMDSATNMTETAAMVLEMMKL
ncbi:MAG: ANTAR domain-containing protein [Lachnospiraceae bacterium]|nr:ANTAR domain-containing protein [Lachnospiraceae bacterium]